MFVLVGLELIIIIRIHSNYNL